MLRWVGQRYCAVGSVPIRRHGCICERFRCDGRGRRCGGMIGNEKEGNRVDDNILARSVHRWRLDRCRAWLCRWLLCCLLVRGLK